MELKINLASREEIAAAVPLLQLILEGVPKTCSGACADPAAVFAAPLPPSGVPSIAGAAPSPIAPEAPTASLPPPPALLPPVPNPAGVAPAPSAPVAPSTPAPGVELDSKGMPWDERIHASTKTKLVSGEWKAKRGVDPALVASVEAELRIRTTDVSVGYAPAPAPAALGVPPAPVAPFVPPAAPLPPAATGAPSVSADPETFEQLMPRITAAVTQGILPPTAVTAACAGQGLASVVALQQQPQFVPLVWASLKASYPGLQ